jgi:hypothetical protein
MVGPGVYADLMASHVFLEQYRRTFDDTRANDEEGRQDIFRAKVIEEFPAQVKSAQSSHEMPSKKTKLTEL